MSVECGECERDLRGGHDSSCSRFDPLMASCTCDPEWRSDCPVHPAWNIVEHTNPHVTPPVARTVPRGLHDWGNE